jgi:hypothetical protein
MGRTMRLRLGILTVLLMGAMLLPGPAAATSLQPAFIRHYCTISTCRYFTSSYHTAIYYYDRTTCSAWKSLSRTYLRGYRTVTRLHQDFPKRKLHPPC